MEQKVIKIGSSIGVTIPKNSLKELGVKVGDSVETETNAAAKTFTVKFQTSDQSPVDPVVIEWTDEFIAKNRELLERLKNK